MNACCKLKIVDYTTEKLSLDINKQEKEKVSSFHASHSTESKSKIYVGVGYKWVIFQIIFATVFIWGK